MIANREAPQGLRWSISAKNNEGTQRIDFAQFLLKRFQFCLLCAFLCGESDELASDGHKSLMYGN